MISSIVALLGFPLAELALALPIGEMWQSCNWIDIVVLLGLLSGLFTGYGVGFYRSTAILLGSTAGVLLAGQFAVPLAATDLFSSIHAEMGPLLTQIISGVTIFCSCAGIALLSTMFLRSFFDRTLRICDNILGAAMGVSLAAILMGMLILGVFQWPDSRIHTPVIESISGPRLADGTRQLSHFFPQEFSDRIDLSLRESHDAGNVFAISGESTLLDPRD
jgi:uncharacterized membrane protein required for colicin V production